MSRVALIESLHGKATEDVDALWREARAEAESYRSDLAQSLERRAAQDAQAAALHARQLEDDATAEARHRAGEVRAQAALALADRLYKIALAELPAMRDAGGADLFVALARELPGRDWQRVRVNPADRDLAREHFPGAEIACDPRVHGGLEVATEDGRIRVDNTLETRLENAWPDVLPRLMADLRAEPNDHRTAQ
jgi:vacuolar-type H+-ATPase subunit E/Vma4